jgi:hypothetical protein
MTDNQSLNGPVEVESIRARVREAFAGGLQAWEDPGKIVQDIQPLLDLAGRYTARGDVVNAAAIYQTVSAEILAHELAIQQDEEGYLHGLIWHCVKQLGRCLEATRESDQREAILRALFDLYGWDVDSGALGLADVVPDIFCETATQAERRAVFTWIQSRLPSGSEWQDHFRRQAWGSLLLALAGEEIDAEAFVQFCREAGLSFLLAERLLLLGRVDDAADEARLASDEELLSLADLFVAHSEPVLADSLVRERLRTSRNERLLDWLKK